MLRPLLIVSTLVLVIATGCHVEIGGTGCAPARTPSGKVVQEAYRELTGDCWEEPAPGESPAALTTGDGGTGDGGPCAAIPGEDPCAACILACAAAGDDCVQGAVTPGTITCSRAHCTAECPVPQ